MGFYASQNDGKGKITCHFKMCQEPKGYDELGKTIKGISCFRNTNTSAQTLPVFADVNRLSRQNADLLLEIVHTSKTPHILFTDF